MVYKYKLLIEKGKKRPPKGKVAGSSPAGGTTEVLATSLRDAQAFPAADFAPLYHRRWGIETDYLRLKQTLQIASSGADRCHITPVTLFIPCP